MSRLGTIELGGTKTLVAAGNSPEDMSKPLRIPTTDPEMTLARAIEHLSGLEVEALGIASFGPVELRWGHPDYGTIVSTPKPGWSGARVLDVLGDGLGVPAVIETDVNGAALGEGRWGAAKGLTDFVYITVGTGIGGGSVVNGRIAGGLGHSEMGHVVVQPHPDDDFPGRCPYHGTCLEGMANGPALEDRFGPPDTWHDTSAAVELISFYLAQALRDLVYVVSPQRIIVGGGVSRIEKFHSRVRAQLLDQLAGYPGIDEYGSEDYVVAPGLGDRSGLAGGLVLAESALGR